jgi:hypothetical protein
MFREMNMNLYKYTRIHAQGRKAYDMAAGAGIKAAPVAKLLEGKTGSGKYKVSLAGKTRPQVLYAYTHTICECCFHLFMPYHGICNTNIRFMCMCAYSV